MFLYRIYDNMDACSVQEVDNLLPRVSLQRREQALRYAHVFGQFCCLKSYVMLSELLEEWGCLYHQATPSNPQFRYNEYGAPWIEGGPFISISHCKSAIAVAVGRNPIGIDVESIRKLDDALIRKTMNQQEQASIFASASPELEFIRYWTRKEAYVKMKATGIIDDMHAILTDTSQVNWHEISNREKAYICTVCERIDEG